MSSLSSFLYQPLLQKLVVEDDMHDEQQPDQHDARGPLHVHVDQQYHLVALSHPSTTNIGDDDDDSDEEEEEVDEESDEDDDDKDLKAHYAIATTVSSNNSSAAYRLLLWLTVPLLLTSQCYMTLWLHNIEPSTASMVPRCLSLTIVLLSILLYFSTLYVLYQTVGGTMAALRNLRHCPMIVTMMIALLIPAEILLDGLLLLVLWKQIEPRFAALLAGSLILGTYIVVMSTRRLLNSAYDGAGDTALMKRRRRTKRFLGSRVQF
jgi:hypothetical protein